MSYEMTTKVQRDEKKNNIEKGEKGVDATAMTAATKSIKFEKDKRSAAVIKIVIDRTACLCDMEFRRIGIYTNECR